MMKRSAYEMKIEIKMTSYSYPYIEKLGAGAFGEVWKVRRNPPTSIWKFAAMKIIKNPDATAWNEVKILKQFQHPNIIKYYCSFKCSIHADLCIVMEFCDMGTLANKIPRVSLIYI